ncbi:c-type cytochrome [Lichenibacterium ramalinae]|uniref:Cytochrome c family protein n=1 Tax=Lichenibacterium ramalinae TaxID=2316527 RepID=A0A4Q2R5J5_9HYPH|nr:cytochrome c family protein [Lichenibacterium ramalinae]RYB01622.1 cytochrome c family protein [Lichenibacterium ramalinae]
MDSFEVNKIAGGVLGTLLATMGLGLVAAWFYEAPTPAKPGYDLPLAMAETSGTGDSKTAAPAKPLPVLLASASPEKGANLAKACGACHNFEKGAGAKIGPPLWGVVDRPVASIPGFSYSEAIKGKGGDWSLDKINAFITSPKGYAPGTKMTYAGETDPQKRADILDYLHTLSDDPKPLPAVSEATPAAAVQPAAAPAPVK